MVFQGTVSLPPFDSECSIHHKTLSPWWSICCGIWVCILDTLCILSAYRPFCICCKLISLKACQNYYLIATFCTLWITRGNASTWIPPKSLAVIWESQCKTNGRHHCRCRTLLNHRLRSLLQIRILYFCISFEGRILVGRFIAGGLSFQFSYLTFFTSCLDSPLL